jgi:hypothetical protein
MIESIDSREEFDEVVCLIDGDSLLYYEMDKPTLEEAVKGITSRVEQILFECGATKYVGFLTEPKCFRYDVSSTYKSNRKGKPKPIIFYALLEYLKQKLGFYTFPKLEADDLVSYYHHKHPDSTIICSPDKDVLYQCIGKHYNYQKASFIETSAEEALKFLWKQVLMGDSTDSIVGIPGVGEKTASNWIQDREKDFEQFVVRKYVEKFGEVIGLHEFMTNFRLVYLLKTDEDIQKELNLICLPSLIPLTFDKYGESPIATESELSDPWDPSFDVTSD